VVLDLFESSFVSAIEREATPHIRPEIIEMQLIRLDIKSSRLMQLSGQLKNRATDSKAGAIS
jgi:hypothetical protein